jgi:hypothetical protein
MGEKVETIQRQVKKGRSFAISSIKGVESEKYVTDILDEEKKNYIAVPCKNKKANDITLDIMMKNPEVVILEDADQVKVRELGNVLEYLQENNILTIILGNKEKEEENMVCSQRLFWQYIICKKYPIVNLKRKELLV